MKIETKCRNCNKIFNIEENKILTNPYCPECWNWYKLDIILEKEKNNWFWIILLIWFAIFSFFVGGINPWLFLFLWWALFLFLYDKFFR